MVLHKCFTSSPFPLAVNVKLADYGISRFANPGGVKGEEGTPGYLAPEAIRRRGEDQAFDEKVCTFIAVPQRAPLLSPFGHSTHTLTQTYSHTHTHKKHTHTHTKTHTLTHILTQKHTHTSLSG